MPCGGARAAGAGAKSTIGG